MSEFVRRLLGREPTVPTSDYRIFTDKFDREVGADELIAQRKGRVRGPRHPGGSVDDLALARISERWGKGHDLGTRPMVTLLLDMSGSMRGEKSAKIFETVLILGTILERIGLAFEVLGFTTSSWRGGKSRVEWVDKWKPAEPGRLCDLLHIRFKTAADDSGLWRERIALLLDNDLLKENVDGEALLWAQKRAGDYRPSKWLCLLVSDGAPVDDSTILANGGEQDNWYLRRHFESVVEKLIAKPDVRLGMLGLERGADKRFKFQRSVGELESCIPDATSLLEEMIWPEHTGG